jgi:MerR family transcriptional regulator, redox-sensitive transcriptional activator SoxR
MLTISEVARQVGLRPSAIRYYEQIGVLPRPQRVSQQRRYDDAALYRLAALQRARQIGFTLDEIRKLFFGFRNGTPPSERWRKLSQQKLSELDQLIHSIKVIQLALRNSGKCGCASLEECGKGLLKKRFGKVSERSRPTNFSRRSKY